MLFVCVPPGGFGSHLNYGEHEFGGLSLAPAVSAMYVN